MIQPGDHIRISYGVYAHHGIYVGNGQVIHFSGVQRGKESATIRYGRLDRFAGGAGLSAIEVVPYAQAFAPEQVIARATSRLGQSGFHLFRNNCEMFARWCKTGQVLSHQVEAAKAAAGGIGGGALATAGGIGVVAGAGTSGASLMSGLATAGSVLGGGAALGIGAVSVGPAIAANVAVRRAFRDDPMMLPTERKARRAARTTAAATGVVASLGTIGAVAAAGVPGLGAVGITTGLAAIGGSMFGGVVVAMTAPAALVAGVSYLAYRIAKRK